MTTVSDIKPKILIVEDESIVANDLKLTLLKLGFSITAIARTGPAAVQSALTDRPDLILMDIRLEGEMDGVQTAEQIRQHLNVPIIFLTAFADENTLHRAKITEPFGYILKPYEERELNNNIQIALYKHQTDSKIKAREQWFSTVLNCIADAVLTVNNDGLITFMNPAAEFILSIEEKEAKHKPVNQIFKIFDEENREFKNHPVLSVIKTGIPSLSDHVILSDWNSISKHISYSAMPLKQEKQPQEGVVVAFRDITRQKNAEQKLHAQLRQNQ